MLEENTMLIQLIIFLTKTKIFASEINSNGKAESISIKGNSEIRCEGKVSIKELIECLYDAYNIDDLADDNFDIVIIEAGADREMVNCLQEKCKGAAKLNIISVEKLLPMIVSNKNLIKNGEEISVTFADMFYKIACDENGVVKIGKARKTEDVVALQENDFSCLYHFIANSATVIVDERILEEANGKINSFEKEIEIMNIQLRDKDVQINNTQNALTNREKEIASLKQKLSDSQKELEQIKGPSGNEVFKKRLEIIKKYENEIIIKEYGQFYTKGNIPKKKLDEALSIIDNTNIKRTDIIALYVGSVSSCFSSPPTNLIIFTNEALYFDKDAFGRAGGYFAYESILRLEQLYWGLSNDVPLNEIEVTLMDKTVCIGNSNCKEIGHCTFVGREWGLKVEIFMNMLKELSEVAEIE